MRWKPKREHVITRGFAFLPHYIPSLKRYVWLERVYIYAAHTAHGSAYWYDTNYRALYNGFVKSFKINN